MPGLGGSILQGVLLWVLELLVLWSSWVSAASSPDLLAYRGCSDSLSPPSPTMQMGKVQQSLHSPRGTGQPVGHPLFLLRHPSPSALSPPVGRAVGSPLPIGMALHIFSGSYSSLLKPQEYPLRSIWSLSGWSLRLRFTGEMKRERSLHRMMPQMTNLPNKHAQTYTHAI